MDLLSVFNSNYFFPLRPETDPWICDEEKKYILACLRRADDKKAASSVPWLQIATSIPFYAIIISHFAENWGLYTMLTQLPTYMRRKIIELIQMK